ncbi:pyridoxal phosphate-dependent decarboxylase family protein [Streptomyces sp. NPDC057702]|uniref:pyridoxal phosphate-dependent decarboxylase family protein n=1 Tax=unclassified Streptomyces TaxID=2593676 RepID=UPI00369FAC6A
MPQQHQVHDLPPDYAEAFEQLRPEYDLKKAEGTTELAAWFLGPRGENGAVFQELVLEALRSHLADRDTVYPHDPVYVTEEMKQTDAYDQAVKRMKADLGELLSRLTGSVPQFSYRHQGHMLWDLTLPGMAGYFAGMLYNQNNVAAEASPVTTILEREVCEDLCALLGYDRKTSWGHITCDGTVANLEAMWAARNLKYYPVALARAVENESGLAKARDVPVTDGAGQQHRLLDLTDWALVNLPMDEVLSLPKVIADMGVPDEAIAKINDYTVQQLGFDRFQRELLEQPLGPPAILAPGTMHYSWPKAASVLGIGQDNLLAVRVDRDAHAVLSHREEILARCRTERRPVIMDIAVLGSTELSAVDPLVGILDLRDKYARHKGVFYPVHVDAAWGGYFAALLRPRPGHREAPTDPVVRAVTTPSLVMSDYVNEQYRALPRTDSITVDPHKAGFLPYPAGALCYRNLRQREMVTFSLRYLVHSDQDPSTGPYAIEGSKPGASAAGVYLSHKVIRPDQDGYGRILGQCLFNSKRLYAGITTMNLHNKDAAGVPRYKVVPVQWLPAEKDHGDVAAQLETMYEKIVTRTNAELVADPAAMDLFRTLGADQVIIGYAFNFYVDGVLNTDVRAANEFNARVYQALSVNPATAASAKPSPPPELVLMFSSLTPSMYGPEFVASFAHRLGLSVPDIDTDVADLPDVSFLISTTMDPWMSDTADGDFTPEIIKHLDKAVRDALP